VSHPRRAVSAGLAALALTFLGSAPAAAGLGTHAVASTICVGVVVDYRGQPTRYGGGSNTYCAKVPAGASGADVLSARSRALGRPEPRYDNGLLCAIDGFPSTGCGATDPHGGYDYWSHWQRPTGAAGWTYAQSGAFDASPGNGDQEGWSWVQGQSERDAPRPPLVAFDQICPPQRSAPSSTRQPTGPTGPGPQPETVLPGGPPNHTTQVPGQNAPPPPAPRSGSSAAPAVRPSNAPGSGPPPGAGAPPTVTSAGPAGPAGPGGLEAPGGAGGPGTPGGPGTTGTAGPQHLTAAPRASHGGGSAGGVVGLGVGAAVIAAIGAAAWWRARAR